MMMSAAVPEECMALTQKEREWIEEQIKAASPDNTGSRRAALWLKQWGMLTACVAVVLALTTISVTLGLFAVSEIRTNSEFRGGTTARLAHLEGDISALKMLMSSLQPNAKNSRQTVKQVLDQARKTSINLPVDVVQQAGLNFINASQSAGAWESALDVLAYRSALNVNLIPPSTAPVPIDGSWKYTINCPRGSPRPTLRFSIPAGSTTPGKAARLDIIGVDQNSDTELVPSLLVVIGGVMALDGQHVRNVVFRNVEVHYGGHSTIIENATFIDCTFVIDNAPPGRRLGELMFASSAVNFKSFV